MNNECGKNNCNRTILVLDFVVKDKVHVIYCIPCVMVEHKGPPKIALHRNMTSVNDHNVITHITCN